VAAPLIADNNEMPEIVELMQQSIPVITNNLNQQKMSDYYFAGSDNKTRQYSRKQAGEILSDIDEAESQIRDYYPNADENYQIVEGIISPICLTHKTPKAFDFSHGVTSKSKPMTDILFSYSVAPNGHIYGEHPHRVKPALFHNWIFQLSQCGVVTFFTLNYVETAQLLVHHYKSCNGEGEHTTLQRYIRQKITLKSHDPFIKSLMSLSLAYNIGIGETKAVALRDAGYKSLMDIAMSDVSELCEVAGIGKTIASKLLESIGRQL
jgi:hypothetical protein